MEFRIAKQEFLRGLRLAQGIADRKSTMPMLANVLLRTQGKNQLLVAATDLNVSLTAELKSTNTSEGGITLGAKNLYELIANAPGDEVTLKKTDNHWAEIKSGKVSYRIVGMPDRDFPKVPDHREAQYSTLESAVLRVVRPAQCGQAQLARDQRYRAQVGCFRFSCLIDHFVDAHQRTHRRLHVLAQ